MKKITSFSIAIKNILHKPIRSFGLMGIVTILSFVLFSGSILSLSLQNGLERMENRLGAELIIVPTENAKDMESILLQGTPNNFYFEKNAFDIIKNIDGIEKITYQFFLKSLNASCCSVPVQLISYDPETDFSVTPWINEVFNGKLDENSIIVGSDITISSSKTLKIFGETYNIVATLEKTSTGLDQSIYVSAETMQQMYKNALEKGVELPNNANPEDDISAILIDLKDDANKRTIMKEIKNQVENIAIIEPQNMVLDIANSLENISGIITIFSTLFLLSSFLTLYIVFTISANERKKEFSILRVVGTTRKKIREILLKEAFLISFIGGVLGIIIGAVFTFPFNTYIEITLGLPYIQPETFEIVKVILTNLIISAIVGPLASIQAANKISKAETYITMKESD